MSGDLQTEFAVLPWTNDQYELQFKEFRKTFPSQILDHPGDVKWKILYPEASSAGPAPQSKFELERTVTSFIRYYAAIGGYTSVIWLGADNMAVSLYYMHQLALDCKNINFEKNRTLRSIKSVVTEVYDHIEKQCLSDDENGKALVIYSGGDKYEAAESLTEIEPFVPEGFYSCIDFMILTMNPEGFKSMLPETDLYIPCQLASSQVQHCSAGTKEMYEDLCENLGDSAREDVEKVLLLVSLLYPNNMSQEFIQAAIEYMAGQAEEDEEEAESGWEEGSTKGFEVGSANSRSPEKALLKALSKLIGAFVLRRTTYAGPMDALCIDRRFQEDFRNTAKANRSDKFMETAESLHSFTEGAFAEPGGVSNPLSNLFKRYKDEDDGHFGSEAAMHQSWLENVSAVDVVATASSSELPKYVTEYSNLSFIGKIALYHRKKLLGEGNHKVFDGYIYEPHVGKTAVAVKRLHGGDQKKIKREIEKLAKLRHTNVVGYKFAETATEYTYIALELCELGTLADWVLNRGPKNDFSTDFQDLSLRFKLLRDVTKGLEYLNKSGIVHRDIKPSNILLKQEGATVTAKIADFDLSKFFGPTGSASASNKTQGSKGYVAPEVQSKSKTYHETDMFSFGKVCYFVLSCGKKPRINPEKISFPFDFYGVAETIRGLVAKKPTDRIPATELLEYPMFWISGDRERFANFIINLFIKHGKENSPFHSKLASIKMNWDSKLTSVYKDLDIEAVIDYRGFPKKPITETAADQPPFKKPRPKNNFDGDAAGFLRFCRNRIEHAKEHKDQANLKFVDQHYYDHAGNKPDFWKFFKTYFEPFPELFFKVWKLAREEPGIPVTELSKTEPDFEPMDFE